MALDYKANGRSEVMPKTRHNGHTQHRDNPLELSAIPPGPG